MSHKIKSRVWIEHNDKIVMGEGRYKLLKSIGETGSLSKAAQTIEMSYKKAWNLMDSVKKNAQYPVVKMQTGGQGGGGTVLTTYGNQLIESYETINKNCWKYLDKQADKLL
jgi:molybdate transport system regulatory protein